MTGGWNAIRPCDASRCHVSLKLARPKISEFMRSLMVEVVMRKSEDGQLMSKTIGEKLC
jgi:hypothetical protein